MPRRRCRWPVLAGSLSNDLEALPAPLVLVLDDYHRTSIRHPHQALLDRLLAHPASGLCLVIITRQDPRLSLGALRVREAMVSEIRVPTCSSTNGKARP
jgi:LuxR family maltose regulon positive regulatory protein